MLGYGVFVVLSDLGVISLLDETEVKVSLEFRAIAIALEKMEAHIMMVIN